MMRKLEAAVISEHHRRASDVGVGADVPVPAAALAAMAVGNTVQRAVQFEPDSAAKTLSGDA